MHGTSRSALLAIVLVALAPIGASAQAPAPEKPKLLTFTQFSIGITASLEGADLAQSMFALGKLQTADERRRKELNLFYAPFDDRPLLTGLVKAGGGAVSGWILARYADKHPKLVLATSLALNGLYVYVVAHNARVTGEQ